MFEVGDRVVCVNDGPDDVIYPDFTVVEPVPLVRGNIYTVLAVYPPLFEHPDFEGNETTFDLATISVGVLGFDELDAWEVCRFRKLRDISQSLTELKALTVNTPALVEARGGVL